MGTPGWLTALIAGLAAIVAATATAFSGVYVAKRKVAEIELTNAFQVAEKYLESARQYTQSVYLPLAVAVHGLHTAFLKFKAVAEEPEMPAAKQEFSDKIAAFIGFANDQFKSGASGVFTFKLDDTLSALIPFLERSTSAADLAIIVEIEMAYSFNYFGLRLEDRQARRLTSNRRSLLQTSGANIALPLPFFLRGASVRLKRTPVLAAAPLHSDEFAERFTVDVTQIKAAIKEVTLGSYSAPSDK
jgi:hypothetical protein